MELLLLLGLGVLGFGFMASGGDDEAAAEESGEAGEETQQPVFNAEDDVLVGTPSDDRVELSDLRDLDTLYLDVQLEAGDDFIDIHADEGEDYLNYQVYRISGGDGDDTIRTDAGSQAVYGGSGDDEIEAYAPYSDNPPLIYGGDGNDTIFAQLDHGEVQGGEGDDVLSVVGGAFNNLVAQINVQGGEGDDSIDFRTQTSFETEGGDQALRAPLHVVFGGAGADSIEAVIGDAARGPFAPEEPEFAADPNPIHALHIADFERGVDSLSIDGQLLHERFAATSARMEEVVDGAGQTVTNVIFRYEAPGLSAHDVFVSINATGLTPADIITTYLGAPIPLTVA